MLIADINSQLPSVDLRTRTLAQACFDRMARQRARISALAAGSPAGSSGPELAALGTLTQAPASESQGK